MVAEVAIICATVLVLAAMGLLYLERNKPKPVQVIPELDKMKEDLIKLESRLNALNVSRLR
jgi:hypothetical protein